jgi:hypothetical protein
MELNIVKYNKINGIFKNQCKMSKDVKQRLHNVVAKPALWFCRETWVLKEDKRRLETSEVRFSHNLVGVTLEDRMRS